MKSMQPPAICMAAYANLRATRTLTSLTALVGCMSTAHAAPIYEPVGTVTEEACLRQQDPALWSQYGQHITDRVHVYLSKDFANDYNDLYGFRDPRQLTQTQTRQITLAAMETWNRESRGPVLVFEGDVDTNLEGRQLDSTCWLWANQGAPDNQALKLPAILVAASPDNGSGYTRSDANITTLDNRFGEPCDSWGYDSMAGLIVSERFPHKLQHWLHEEFGVVLGLGRTGDGTGVGPISVTQDYDGVTAFAAETGNTIHQLSNMGGYRDHLWPWDVDCVDDDLSTGAMDGRARMLTLRARGRGLSSTWSKAQTVGITPKSSDTGTAIHLDSGRRLYGTVAYDPGKDWSVLVGAEDSIDSGVVIADGNIDMNDFSSSFDDPELTYAPVASHVLSHWNSNAGDDVTVVYPSHSALQSAPVAVEVNAEDPPRFYAARHSGPGKSVTTTAVQTCSLPGNCTPQELRSHIPLRSAWSNTLERHIYLSVRTRDCQRDYDTRLPDTLYSWSNDTHQRRCDGISVHPGDEVSPGTTLLNYPQTVTPIPGPDPTSSNFHGYWSPTTTLPVPDYIGDSDTYEYSASTHVAPAIACGPAQPGHNDVCIMAWVDRGTPDNHILYAFFSVYPSIYVAPDAYDTHFWGQAKVLRPAQLTERNHAGHTIATMPNTAIATSASDLTAMFAQGHFWLTYKGSTPGYENTVHVAETSLANNSEWANVDVFVDDETIDAPSFVFDPLDDEAEIGLLWTTLD